MNPKRNTVQRQLTLEALKDLNIHATAEQVYARVADRHPSVSKATVYRNLSQMADAGELAAIGRFDGAEHYDHNCRAHYHFVCERCKKVYDIDSFFPDMKERLTGMDGFEIKSHRLTFSGLCRQCVNAEGAVL